MRRGFTMIELLVVMAIIAALAGLLVPVVTILQRRATETRCRALLAKVATAIEAYQQDRKRLPAWQGAWNPGDWAWVEANAAMLQRELVSDAPDHRGNPRPAWLADELRPQEVVDGRIVDPWGRPLVYYATPWAGARDGARPFAGNAQGFELWSAGRDRAFHDLRPATTGADADRDNLPARPYDPSWQR